jgi:hypothetical protein
VKALQVDLQSVGVLYAPRGWGSAPQSLGFVLVAALFMLLPKAWAAPPTLSIAQTLQDQYDAWQPALADTTPLALLKAQGLEWDAATYELTPLFDEARGFAELRGVARLPDGQQSVGVLRAGLYRRSAAESVLVLNDEWCAAGLCKARTRFVLIVPGRVGASLPEPKLVPRILDSDLLGGPAPDCLRGVALGVQYLPSRYDATLTALATVSPVVRLGCEAVGTELSLVTRPLRLLWNAGARKFVRAW